MSINQTQPGNIPAVTQAALDAIGVDHIELSRPPASDADLIDVFALVGRADANAFERHPALVGSRRSATERERKAYGLPPEAFALVSRGADGVVVTEYLA